MTGDERVEALRKWVLHAEGELGTKVVEALQVYAERLGALLSYEAEEGNTEPLIEIIKYLSAVCGGEANITVEDKE